MTHPHKLALYFFLPLFAFAGEHAAAEVLNVAPNGFEIRETAHIAAPTDKVYGVLIKPANWWSSEHTYSHNSANLSLEARAGGCWCESLPDGGSVEHLRVVYVSPGKLLRLKGGLGPLQALPVDGAMTWSVKSVADGTELSFTYSIGGYVKDGIDGLSKAVDHVLGEQVARLKKFAEGEPAPRGH